QHLVRPDGTINLGVYGEAYVAGMTLAQAKDAVSRVLKKRITTFDPRDLNVDVLAYNSKVYYIITDGGGYGERVDRFYRTGNETGLDALSYIQGLSPVSSKKHIWVARRAPGDGSCDQVLKVDWCGITKLGGTSTNFQILPGDRIYVQADHLIKL